MANVSTREELTTARRVALSAKTTMGLKKVPSASGGPENHGRAAAGPQPVPKRKSADPFASEKESPVITEENRKRATACRAAFAQLIAFKGLAIPFMVEHFDDKRPSMDFHGHWEQRDIGAACYWNIRHQLENQPGDYSSYGFARKGRDGESHVKPNSRIDAETQNPDRLSG